MTLTLKAKLIGGVVGMALTVAGLGGACAYGTREFSDEISALTGISIVLRQHTIGDMLHDALRADVFAALVAAADGGQKKDEILAETREHTKKFSEVLAQNRAADVPQSVKDALAGVEQPLAAYVVAADRIVNLAFVDRAKAGSLLSEFDAKFSALEKAMETAGDKIEAVAVSITEESQAFSDFAVRMSAAFFVIGVTMTIGLIVVVMRETIKPLLELERTMGVIAGGQSDIEIAYLARADEIGAMARSIEVFKSNAKDREQLQEQERETREKELTRQRQLEVILREFNEKITVAVSKLGGQIGAMKNVAATLTSTAEMASAEASSAAAATEGAADNSQAVAAATEQLGASIREISTQAHQTSAIVAAATEVSTKTDRDVAGLAEATSRIGSVVELIRKIAEQTNLLALNATIEAARAGDTGKGFAVVASEVKNLANQTAKATDEISHQIEQVQASTRVAVDSIRAISSKVGEINGLTGAIAAAVEEQEAATRDIAKNVTLAADRSKQAARNVGSVTETAGRTREQVATVTDASESLELVTSDIKSALEKFVAMLGTELKERRQSWRQPVDRPAVVVANGQRVEVRAIDFSLGGMRMTAIPNASPGQRVTVDFGDGPVPATIEWGTRTGTSVKFERAFDETPVCLSDERIDDQRNAA